MVEILFASIGKQSYAALLDRLRALVATQGQEISLLQATVEQLTGSFIPPTEQRELRDLTRYRASVVEDRARVVNRLQKVREDTNIKLGDVATDITGQSARAMLKALLEG